MSVFKLSKHKTLEVYAPRLPADRWRKGISILEALAPCIGGVTTRHRSTWNFVCWVFSLSRFTSTTRAKRRIEHEGW